MATKTTPLINEAVSRYLDSRALDLKPKSLQTYRNVLARFVAFMPVKQIGRVSRDDIERFLVACKRGDLPNSRGPMNDTSLRHMMQTLDGLFAYCQRQGWTVANVMVEKHKRPKRAARRDYLRLTADELLLALEQAECPRDRICLATAMNTGLRSNELKLLKLTHFDLDNGFVYAAIPKGRVSDMMPISLDFRSEIDRWLAIYESECGTLQPSWFFLPTRNRPIMRGPRVIEPGPFNPERPFHDTAYIARKALLKLGYSPERITYEGMHTFRRSVARLYFDLASQEGGTDSALRETASLLHHANTQTTELYLGITPETERRNRRLAGKPFLTALASERVARLKDDDRGTIMEAASNE